MNYQALKDNVNKCYSDTSSKFKGRTYWPGLFRVSNILLCYIHALLCKCIIAYMVNPALVDSIYHFFSVMI